VQYIYTGRNEHTELLVNKNTEKYRGSQVQVNIGLTVQWKSCPWVKHLNIFVDI